MNLNRINLPEDNVTSLNLIQIPKFVIQSEASSSYTILNEPTQLAQESSSSSQTYRAKRVNNIQNEPSSTTIHLNLDNLASADFDEQIELYHYENTDQLRFIDQNLVGNICSSSNNNSNQHLHTNSNLDLDTSSNCNSSQDEEEFINTSTQHMFKKNEINLQNKKKFRSIKALKAARLASKKSKWNCNRAFKSSDYSEGANCDQLNSGNSQFNERQTTSIVPTLNNVDEIFQLLSHKIAKYCQVLADLTNCEAFFKAQLPQQLNNVTTNVLNSFNYDTQTNGKKKLNINKRSLYWGTHQMLFQYSHNYGLKLDKNGGDSLIKITQRSLSNDVNNLVEEILNEEPLKNLKHPSNKIENLIEEKSKLNTEPNTLKEINFQTNSFIPEKIIEKTDNVQIKECSIMIKRLNDHVYDQYLNKFEHVNNQPEKKNQTDIDLDVPDEHELYESSEGIYKLKENIFLSNDSSIKTTFHNSIVNSKETDNEEDEEDNEDNEDDDEKTLFEKNCFNITDDNEENFYTCDLCINSNFSFKHLTQLKLHQLQVHQNIILSQHGPFECQKCKLSNGLSTRIQYLKHLLLCYYPDIYTCKTCLNSYDNYLQYLFHVRYVHTHVVYMCAICSRKYKNIKDLLDHDQLMHSKTVNYCEMCFEPQKSRNELFEHYRKTHLNEHNRLINDEFCLQSVLDENSINDSSTPDFLNQVTYDLVQNRNSPIFYSEPPNDEFNTKISKKYLKITKTKEHEKNSASTEKIEWRKSKVQKNDLVRGLIDRKHQCKWCSLRFYSKSQLKQHEATHVNSILYCPVCDKEFTHKDRLAGHMKCHMEPSLECKVCGKKFKRLCNLYNHELVHGLTEHAFMLCQFCGRGFRSRRDYQNHVIANHREQLMKSDSCSNNIWTKTSSSNSAHSDSSKKTIIKNKINNYSNNRKQSADDAQVQIINNHQLQQDSSKNMSILEIEPDTYFTRTDIVQFNRDALEEVDLDNPSLENDEFNNDNIDESSFESDINTKNTSNKTKFKNHNLIRNKFKRLKSSLNVEVVDDNDEKDHVDDNHHLSLNGQDLNTFSHILNQNIADSKQINHINI